MRLRLLPATIVATLTRGLARIVGRVRGCPAVRTDMGPVAEPARSQPLPSPGHLALWPSRAVAGLEPRSIAATTPAMVSPSMRRAGDPAGELLAGGPCNPGASDIPVGESRGGSPDSDHPVVGHLASADCAVIHSVGASSLSLPNVGSRQRRMLQGTVAALVLWTIAETVRTSPHCLAYANQLAGGPENCWEHLLGSSCDWGQDYLFIRDFIGRTSTGPSILRNASYDPRFIIGAAPTFHSSPTTLIAEATTLQRSMPDATILGRVGGSLFWIDGPASEGASLEVPTFDHRREVALGRILLGDRVRHTFAVTNTSSQAIRVTQVDKACSCQLINVSIGKSISPGSTALVTFATSVTLAGSWRSSVHLKTDAADPFLADIELILTADVQKAIDIFPEFLHFGSLAPGSRRTASVLIRSNVTNLIGKLDSVTFAGEFGNVDVVEHSAELLSLIVSINSHVSPGYHHGSIDLAFRHGRFQRFQIPVSVDIRDGARTIPRLTRLPSVGNSVASKEDGK